MTGKAKERIENAIQARSTKLDLSFTDITSLPEDTQKLIGLQILHLNNTEITTLPDCIQQFKNLLYLSLSNTRLEKLPDGMQNLTNLQILDLSENNLSELPEWMQYLSNLQYLFLKNTRIKILPDWMQYLPRMWELYQSNMQRNELPTGMQHLPYLQILDLKNIKLGIPQEIINKLNNPGEILTYYFKEIKSKAKLIKIKKNRSEITSIKSLEKLLYKAVFSRDFKAAKKHLEEITIINSEKGEKLKDEFAFIYILTDMVNTNKREQEKFRQKLEWQLKVYEILSKNSQFEFKYEKEKIKKEKLDQKKDEPKEPIEEKKQEDEEPPIIIEKDEETSEQKGEELEVIIEKLFKKFFTICAEKYGIHLYSLRRQKRGSQFGYDLEIIYEIDRQGEIRICIECKNYKKTIHHSDIAEKLDAVKAHRSDIDHWILISPRADVSNDLDYILRKWEETNEYPFRVQVWSPSTQIDDFFGLEPSIYDSFFKPKVSEQHPDKWNDKKIIEIINKWKNKLYPKPCFPTGWNNYLQDVKKLLLPGDPPEFEQLYNNYIPLKFRNESGESSEQLLENEVEAWLNIPLEQSTSLLLLGEFGDGKTAFVYILTRKLIDKFKKAPKENWLPLRFSLKDFTWQEKVRDSQDFVSRRLVQFGADINGWDSLKKSDYKILAILDGFDEISKKLDYKTISNNIDLLIGCYRNEFQNMKIIISSRTHFFDNKANKEKLLSRIGSPKILYLERFNRKLVEEHLAEYANQIGEKEKFEKIKDIHDPIGLASKPLFLQMIKRTLKKLPDNNINVLLLYETYIEECLSRKIELIENKDYVPVNIKLRENMKKILEWVAVQLQYAKGEYVFLSDFKEHKDLTKRLWDLSDPDNQQVEDGTTQITVRSLLHRVFVDENEIKKWPVDFCHRSMREYFMARFLCQKIKENMDEAKKLLNTCSLNNEILYFASNLMKNEQDNDYQKRLLKLIQMTKSLKGAERTGVGFTGSNAINLLYRYKGELPGGDWSHLILDGGAELSGADLSYKDFSHTSLRYANLDNINAENSDFSYADLTGVRLEETSPVLSLSVSPSQKILVLYDDGTIREWCKDPINKFATKIVCQDIDLNKTRLYTLFGNTFALYQDAFMNHFDIIEKEYKKTFKYELKSIYKLLSLKEKSMILLTENNSNYIVHLFDIQKKKSVFSEYTSPSTLYDNMDFKAVVSYSDEQGLILTDFKTDEKKQIEMDSKNKITCLTTCIKKKAEPEEIYLLACGNRDGIISIFEILFNKTGNDISVVHIKEEKIHENVIKSIAFLNKEYIVSGGFDRKLCITEINKDIEAGKNPKELILTLRCKGMKIDHIIREEERKRLAELTEKYSS